MQRGYVDRGMLRIHPGAIRLIVAAFLPIAVWILCVWTIYAFTLWVTLPDVFDFAWLACLGFLIGGAFILAFGPWARATKALMIVVYVPLMAVALFVAGLSTGCSMGDCL
jgi:hypothetical protein